MLTMLKNKIRRIVALSTLGGTTLMVAGTSGCQEAMDAFMKGFDLGLGLFGGA